jgi:hypothetical protein
MKTFTHPISVRLFLLNGGNVMTRKIVLSNDVMSELFTIKTRDGNKLLLTNSHGDLIPIHIDMCWVLVEILID